VEEQTPSIVTIKLHLHKEGTSVELHHSNIPDEAFEEIKDGCNAVYFGSLKDGLSYNNNLL